jgi:regulator of protease activity HflC (stomatin/prohibitin superfamily)
MDNMQRSLKYRLLKKLGWQFVEPKTLLVVFRDERFNRFLEPGYHTPINKWRESYAVRPISTEPRFISIDKILVRTADSIQVKLDISILFRFDPRECPTPQTKANVVDYSYSRIEKTITNLTSNLVRSICGQYSTFSLASGSNRQLIEGKLTAHLHRKLNSFGLLLVGQAPISILTVSVPPAIEKELEEALRQKIYTLTLKEQSENANEAFLRREVLTNSNSVKLRIKQNNLSWSPENPTLPTVATNGHQRHQNLNNVAN